ncbi:MAG: PaaI family thioesterase [Acidobacteria bacterium]|nr:MAG: PaaI family thioesterase [Acidobacteriota bacterium]
MATKGHTHGHGTKSVPLKKNYCFACGKDNPDGMHLKFTINRERKRFVSSFRLSKRFTGPPGYCHGGIIATILDDAMSKLNKLRDVIAATAELKIEYLKPVPLRTPLRVESRELTKRGRRLIHRAEILNQEGRVLARGRGVFVIIDANRVFSQR